MRMKTLTKENYFDDLTEKCPRAMEHFLKWIDEYKKEVGWCNLFRPLTTGGAKGFTYIKFHQLPYEMQVGIMLRYAKDIKFNFIYYNNDIRTAFSFMMRYREYELKYGKKW